MAQADPVELRLKFLKEAALLLALSAPASSAVLGTEHGKLLQVDDADLEASTKDWNALRREVCGACGSLMLPGWSCKVSYEVQAASKDDKRKRRQSAPGRPEKAVVYTCSRCNQKTTLALQARQPKHITRSKAETNGDAIQVLENKMPAKEEPNRIIKTANASSKQRKKARKGGLQAMLDKSKTQKNGDGGLGLDLMDFMG